MKQAEHALTLKDKVVGLIWPHIVSIQCCRPSLHCRVSSTHRLISGCKMTLTHTTACLPSPSDPQAAGKKMAAKGFWHMNRQLSALHYPSLSELIERWLVWTGHAECFQAALLLLLQWWWWQAGLVSGSGGAAGGGSKEWSQCRAGWTGGATTRYSWEGDCQVPPAGPITLLHAGRRKQVLLLHHCKGKTPWNWVYEAIL